MEPFMAAVTGPLVVMKGVPLYVASLSSVENRSSAMRSNALLARLPV